MFKKLLVLLLLVALTAGVASAELRAWYKFDETSDANVADSSGNGFNTVVSNVGTTPEWDTEGAIGGCLQETGLWTAMYVDVPAAVFSTMSTQATFAWWAQLTPTSVGGGWFTGNDGSGDMIKAIPYPSGDNWYGVYRAGSTTTNWWWGYGAASPVGEWHHFALVFDSVADIKKLYFDGDVVSNPGITEGDSMADIDVFKLFSRTAAAPAAWDVFKGKMDDFRIYDEALSDSEIERLSTPITASQFMPADGQIAEANENSDLTLYWKSGVDAADVNGHHVYFGEDYNSVNNATLISDEYQGTQTANSYDLYSLSDVNTYYWRIDE
ncbi:MAG: LamG domain-containing protein, partial [Planctomycetes bacterium]|nr:LamG domain-containing protein [Planctomycetota bacterium]